MAWGITILLGLHLLNNLLHFNLKSFKQELIEESEAKQHPYYLPSAPMAIDVSVLLLICKACAQEDTWNILFILAIVVLCVDFIVGMVQPAK